MGEGTKIEWADHTFNPWMGCTKVSEACRNCYAETLMDHRYGKVKWGKGQPRTLTSESNWQKPTSWNKKAIKATVRAKEFGVEAPARPRVFCSSLADVFDDEVPQEWRDRLWALIASCRNIDWLLLTKRPENAARDVRDGGLPWNGGEEDAWPHVFVGVTVENQKTADERLPILVDITAVKRFVSMEPLLESVDLSSWTSRHLITRDNQALTNEHEGVESIGGVWRSPIDWVIAGGESGDNARPSHPDWFRSLRDQCLDADVPFLFKQWGEWAPRDRGLATIHPFTFLDNDTPMVRVGKKKAGRLLDDKTHDGFPK